MRAIREQVAGWPVLSWLSGRRPLFLILACASLLGALVFLPGKSGPMVFDDASNLLGNSYVQIRSLDADSLYRASTSLEAGPLRRPVAMLSFALNHYFAGSFDDSTPYKVTNIAIHALNGLLVFWLVNLILKRLSELTAPFNRNHAARRRHLPFLACAVALFWVMHPIQLTSVLYVVQRMTALSGTFILVALICYLAGRMRMIAKQPGGVRLAWGGLLLFGMLGVLSKETAVLLPAYMLALEFALFRGETPWTRWCDLSVRARRFVIASATIVGIAVIALAVHYALPKYAIRDFTMTQRLLTESRVLFFYLSLILLPRLNQFSLFHDDITLSTSLLSPWTTLPSIGGILVLLGVAYFLRARLALVSLGIVWFFAGHLLESTILALEIAHEHRNYLPSLGPLLAVVAIVDDANRKLKRPWLLGLLPLLLVVTATVSLMRATQWSSDYSLFLYETAHNPNSASVNAGFASRLIAAGKYREGMEAFRRAALLAPEEPAYLLYMNMFGAQAGERFDHAGAEETLRRLTTGRITATTVQALGNLGDCVLSWCQSLGPSMETWIRTVLDQRDHASIDTSFFHHLLARALASQGKTREAMRELQRSHEIDRRYLHPLFDLAYLYVREHDSAGARATIEKLREANKAAGNPRTDQIEEINKEIEELLANPPPIPPSPPRIQ